jgi:hypothetical protein
MWIFDIMLKMDVAYSKEIAANIFRELYACLNNENIPIQIGVLIMQTLSRILQLFKFTAAELFPAQDNFRQKLLDHLNQLLSNIPRENLPSPYLQSLCHFMVECIKCANNYKIEGMSGTILANSSHLLVKMVELDEIVDCILYNKQFPLNFLMEAWKSMDAVNEQVLLIYLSWLILYDSHFLRLHRASSVWKIVGIVSLKFSKCLIRIKTAC